MNLRNVYFVCKENYEIIKKEEYRDAKYLFSSGSKEFIRAIRNLNKIEYVREITEQILKYTDKRSPKAAVNNEIWDLIDLLKTYLAAVIKLYESMGINVKEHLAIDICFPKTNNITEFKKNIDALEFIFTKCPFLQNENESFQFEGVDVGSTWMRLSVIISTAVVTGSMLLANTAAFIDQCMVIRSHYLTIQEQRRAIENDEIEQQQREAILGYIDLLYKRQVDEAIREMEEISGHEIVDGDERGRAEQSFEKLGKLLDKGLQIYSSIDSPQETKALFEPLEMKYLSIANEMKSLTDNNDTHSNDN